MGRAQPMTGALLLEGEAGLHRLDRLRHPRLCAQAWGALWWPTSQTGAAARGPRVQGLDAVARPPPAQGVRVPGRRSSGVGGVLGGLFGDSELSSGSASLGCCPQAPRSRLLRSPFSRETGPEWLRNLKDKQDVSPGLWDS